MQAPVPIYTFVDGAPAGQQGFGGITWNTDALAQNLTGRTVAQTKPSKPVCKVNLSSSFSIPQGVGGTNNIVTWNNLVYDSDGMWPGSPSDHMTVQTAGWYRIMAQAWWASGGAERVVQVLINGTDDPNNVVASSSENMGASSTYHQQVVAYEHLAVGAHIYIGVFQSSGAALNLTTNNSVGSWGTWWTAAWHAPY